MFKRWPDANKSSPQIRTGGRERVSVSSLLLCHLHCTGAHVAAMDVHPRTRNTCKAITLASADVDSFSHVGDAHYLM